jgi:hypothetical protein
MPVELEAEILVIAKFKVVVDDGSSYDGMVLSYFANPILFHVETPSGSSEYYATTRSEPEVLAFFHAFQSKKELGKPLGWYPPQ